MGRHVTLAEATAAKRWPRDTAVDGIDAPIHVAGYYERRIGRLPCAVPDTCVSMILGSVLLHADDLVSSGQSRGYDRSSSPERRFHAIEDSAQVRPSMAVRSTCIRHVPGICRRCRIPSELTGSPRLPHTARLLYLWGAREGLG